ncbi:MAG: hypothetical protein IJ894_04735 [Bacteroidales bacterium]|nr:hypothetical protein [Bacteroidales bacterium]
MKTIVHKIILIAAMALISLPLVAQEDAVFKQLKDNPQKAYGNDCPYPFDNAVLTKPPKGYKPFYISHYGRHGSRYYWNEKLYAELDTLLTEAHSKGLLTPLGKQFYTNFMSIKDELTTGVSELTQLGWEQHQKIARIMYNNFPEVFKKGGNVLAISSLTGRCVISMSAFCQELVQCNPKIEIREQSSRFTLDGVVPSDKQNPVKHTFTKSKPRYEANINNFPKDNDLRDKIISRVFSSTDGLPGNLHHISSNLMHLYTSLPNIAHEGIMDGIITDDEMIDSWERSNLGSYSWVFSLQSEAVPILRDIINKTDAVISGKSDHIADLRFGHDSFIGPLTVLMGLNGADRDPENPSDVKNCYQNFETCMACNLQLVFYRSGKASDDVLVKCLLNGKETRLPVETGNWPYYKWTDVKKVYEKRCKDVKKDW